MGIQDLLNLFRKGKATAKSHMKNLIEMAAVDGNFDDVEYTLLKSIAKQNGISESRLKEIRNNPQNIVFTLPDDKKERFFQFYDLVHMMSIDNQVHPDEMKLCNIFAGMFGYPKEHANELIEIIKSNIQNGQDAEETLKRVTMIVEASHY